MILRILNKANFTQKFLHPISRINDLCTLTIQENSIYNLNRTVDSSLSLYSVCEDIEVLDYTEKTNISFADIKKFIKAFDCISDATVDLIINANSVEYKSNGTKFKFHLINDNIVKSPNYNIEKINSLQFDNEFMMNISIYNLLIKSSTFITNSNKIYIGTDGGNVIAELTDKSKSNVDSYSTKISEVYSGSSIEKPLSFNFDLFRNVSFLKTTDILIRINNKGFIAFDVVDDKYKLKYTATAYSV